MPSTDKKKPKGFGDLYDLEQQQKTGKPTSKKASKPTRKKVRKSASRTATKPESKTASKVVSKSESKVSPVSFKADPAKVKAIKVWGVTNDRKLQDLFDEALSDLMRKHGIS